MAEDTLTYQDFASKIKAKYPQYKDVDDLELSKKIVDKYPQYKSQVSFESTERSPSVESIAAPKMPAGGVQAPVQPSRLDKQLPVLQQRAAKTFAENQELFSNPAARAAYYNRLSQSYTGMDYYKVRSAIMQVDPYLKAQAEQGPFDALNPLGETIPTAISAAAQGIQAGVEQGAKTREIGITEGPAAAALNPLVATGKVALGVGGAVMPELAAFNVAMHGLETSAPDIAEKMAPFATAVRNTYKKEGKEPPSWVMNWADIGDFVANAAVLGGAAFLKGLSVKKIEQVRARKPIEHAEETQINDLSKKQEAILADVEKVSSPQVKSILKDKADQLTPQIDALHEAVAAKNEQLATHQAAVASLESAKAEITSQMENVSAESKIALNAELENINQRITALRAEEFPNLPKMPEEGVAAPEQLIPQQNAIQERIPAPLPMDAPPRSGPEVGARIPAPEKPAEPFIAERAASSEQVPKEEIVSEAEKDVQITPASETAGEPRRESLSDTEPAVSASSELSYLKENEDFLSEKQLARLKELEAKSSDVSSDISLDISSDKKAPESVQPVEVQEVAKPKKGQSARQKPQRKRIIGTPKARRQIKDERYLKALAVEPESPLESALQYFIGGGQLNSAAFESFYGGGRNKRAAGSERSMRLRLVNNKTGKGIDAIAHELWQAGDTERFTTRDYREAIEDVLNSHNSETSMAVELLKNRGIEVEAKMRPTEEAADALPDEIKDELIKNELSPTEVENIELSPAQHSIVQEVLSRHRDVDGNLDLLSLKLEIEETDPLSQYPETRELKKLIDEETLARSRSESTADVTEPAPEKTAGRVKAEKEYAERLAALNDQLDQAKRQRSAKAGELSNRASDLFEGTGKEGVLFDEAQDASAISKAVKPLDDAVNAIQKQRDEFVASKEKQLSKYDSQTELPSEPTRGPHPIIEQINQAVKNGKSLDKAIHEASINLSGDSNATTRQEIIAALTGNKPPKSKAGYSYVETAISEYFAKQNVDAAVESTITFLKKNKVISDDPTLAKNSFVDLEKAIRFVGEAIKKGIDLHGDITRAINEAIEDFKTSRFYKSLKPEAQEVIVEQIKKEHTPRLTEGDAEKIVKEETVKPSKEQLKTTVEKTTGVKKESEKITLSEKTLLNKQIRDVALGAKVGYRAGVKDAKALRDELASGIKSILDSPVWKDKINARQTTALLKKAAEVKTEVSLDNFLDYAKGVIQDVNYLTYLDQAKAARNKALAQLKNKNTPLYNKEIIQQVKDLPLNKVYDLTTYTDILNSVASEISGKESGRKFTQNEITEFIDHEKFEIQKREDERLTDQMNEYKAEGLLEGKTTLDEYKSMLDDLDRFQEEGKVTPKMKDRIIDRIKDNIGTLKEEAISARQRAKNVRPETPLEKSVLDNVLAFDPYVETNAKVLQRLNNVLNNYIEAGDLSGAGDIVAAHQRNVRLKEAMDKGIKIKQLQTRNRIIFNRNIARKTLPNIMRELTYTKDAAASVSKLTVSKIKQAVADAHDTRNKVMAEMLTVADKAGLKEKNNVRLHVYSMLNQAKGFTIDGKPASFEQIRERLQSDADRMIEYGNKYKSKGSGDTWGKDYVEWGNLIKEILEKDFADAKTAEEVRSRLSDAEKQIYDKSAKFFSDRADVTQEVTHIVENKAMPLVENYFPLDAMRLGEESTADLALAENDFSKSFVNKQQAGSTFQRVPLEHDRVYNPQFLQVFGKKAFDQEFYNLGQQELHTLSSILNDKRFADVVNETFNPDLNLENATIMRKKISEIVNEWKQSGSLPNENVQVVNYVLSKTIGTLLSTVGQLPKQYVPNIIQSTVINGLPATVKAMSLKFGKTAAAREQLLSAMSGKIASMRGEILLEESLYKNQLAGMKSDAFASLRNLRENTPIISSVLNLGRDAFRLGDQAGRNDTFVASYIKSLIDQGKIKNVGEFDIFKEASKPNEQALSYAETTAPTIANISTAAERPELVKSTSKREWSDKIQWTLLTYGLNSYESAKTASRILFDARATNSERTEAARDLSGYLSQIAAFGLISYAVKSGYRAAGEQVASALGKDQGEDQKKKQTEKDLVRMAAKATTDVVLQGSPLQVQEAAQYAVNKAYQFVNKNLTEHPYSYVNEGTIRDARFKPFYGTDNPTLGIMDVPLDVVSDATALTTKKSKEETEEQLANRRKTESAIITAKIVAMLLSNGDLYSLANYTSSAMRAAEDQQKENQLRNRLAPPVVNPLEKQQRRINSIMRERELQEYAKKHQIPYIPKR